ncbi:MAG: 23S rRNA (adenine(2503)-C(2))-methyltransferase RlmN [Patescibacteria group bacterium]|nr:23S rRNA (adenine(2503)-C(2))-methyltransferase RlmN [Patescibacteria group bacterium]
MNFIKMYKILELEPSFRKKQVEKAIFGLAINDWDVVTTLPKTLKEKLKKECPFKDTSKDIQKELIKIEENVVKARLNFTNDLVETVLMRYKSRNTVCVSSQVGCPLGCSFCLTGQNGFKRNLNSFEIIEQILFFKRYLKKYKENVTNVVFMGMGEPFLNYNAVVKAIKMINSKDGFNISNRKISVSTIGLIPKILRFTKDCPQCNLAFSLHAPNNKLRSILIPANKKHPLKKVLSVLKKYQIATNRSLMIEYIMLKGVNDSLKDAEELSHLLKSNLKSIFVVNLIKYNETGKYESSTFDQIRKFKNILLRNKINVVERYRLGDSINAACGQLTNKNFLHIMGKN